MSHQRRTREPVLQAAHEDVEGPMNVFEQSLAGLSYADQVAATRPPVPHALTRSSEQTAGGSVQLKKESDEPETVTGYIGLNVGADSELAELEKALEKVENHRVIGVLDDPDNTGLSGVDLVDAFKESGIDIYTQGEETWLVFLGLGVPMEHPRFPEMVAWLASHSDGKDQMAGALKLFWDAQNGVYNLQRLLFSGHSTGGTIWGEQSSSGEMNVFSDIEALADFCPGAAAQVEDMMFSACWSFSQEKVDFYLRLFPNLQSVWAYIGFSPSAKSGGSQKHIKNWEKTTRGHDPDKIERRGKTVAVWTRDMDAEEGQPAGSIQMPNELPDIEELDQLFYFEAIDILGDYFDGVREPADNAELREIYGLCQTILIHPDASAELVESYVRVKERVFRLRKWPKILKVFPEHHAELLDSVGVPAKMISDVKRKDVNTDLIEMLSQRKDAVRAGTESLPHAGWLEDANELFILFEHGLWELEAEYIPASWVG